MNHIKSVFYPIISMILIAYPFLVYFGLQHIEPRSLALWILLLLLLRFWVAQKQMKWENIRLLIPITLAGSALCLIIVALNNMILVQFYPIVINVVLFLLFVSTLIKPPSMIERLARLTTPNLPKHAISYTRNVTLIWCIFFIFNVIMATLTTFYATLEMWTLYNGLIAYILMGLIFIIEYGVRQYKMKTYDNYET